MLRQEGLPGDTRKPRGLTPAQLTRLFNRAAQLSGICRPQRDALSALLALDIDWQLAESLLQKADKMSMGASIELRTPILDLEIAKIAARIPSSLKLHHTGIGKYILRKTIGRKLNEDLTRPKKGFPVPLGKWFAGPLRERVEAELFVFASTPAAIYRIWSEETLCRKDPRLVARVRTSLIDTLLDWLRQNHKLTPAHTAAAGQVFFEQARTWARYNLPEAAAYSAERNAHGPYQITGPAAPRTYRLIHKLLGFTAAEKIANFLR